MKQPPSSHIQQSCLIINSVWFLVLRWVKGKICPYMKPSDLIRRNLTHEPIFNENSSSSILLVLDWWKFSSAVYSVLEIQMIPRTYVYQTTKNKKLICNYEKLSKFSHSTVLSLEIQMIPTWNSCVPNDKNKN